MAAWRKSNPISKSNHTPNMSKKLSEGPPAFEVRWTHKGAALFGFKQEPPAASDRGAMLLGCEALLENDWCWQRLP